MTTLDELIERLQKATEPSWELDSAIAETIGWHLDKGDHLFPWANPNGDLLEDCPHFTASLDAALTLVPEGFIWGVGYEVGAAAFVCAKSSMYREESVCKAATPTIALCIAALKARKVTP